MNCSIVLRPKFFIMFMHMKSRSEGDDHHEKGDIKSLLLRFISIGTGYPSDNSSRRSYNYGCCSSICCLCDCFTTCCVRCYWLHTAPTVMLTVNVIHLIHSLLSPRSNAGFFFILCNLYVSVPDHMTFNRGSSKKIRGRLRLYFLATI